MSLGLKAIIWNLYVSCSSHSTIKRGCEGGWGVMLQWISNFYGYSEHKSLQFCLACLTCQGIGEIKEIWNIWNIVVWPTKHGLLPYDISLCVVCEIMSIIVHQYVWDLLCFAGNIGTLHLKDACIYLLGRDSFRNKKTLI